MFPFKLSKEVHKRCEGKHKLSYEIRLFLTRGKTDVLSQ